MNTPTLSPTPTPNPGPVSCPGTSALAAAGTRPFLLTRSFHRGRAAPCPPLRGFIMGYHSPQSPTERGPALSPPPARRTAEHAVHPPPASCSALILVARNKCPGRLQSAGYFWRHPACPRQSPPAARGHWAAAYPLLVATGRYSLSMCCNGHIQSIDFGRTCRSHIQPCPCRNSPFQTSPDNAIARPVSKTAVIPGAAPGITPDCHRESKGTTAASSCCC